MTPARSRKVLITGGSRGIGASLAAELKLKGWCIEAPPRHELDLSQQESIDQYLKSHSQTVFDALINNAGINMLNSIDHISTADWQAMLQTNLSAALQLTQAFAPRMADQEWGRILNISSIFSIVTKEKRAAYSMTKAALNALTRSAAVEYGPKGVLVNALAPGYVDTQLTRQNNSPAQIAAIKSAIPLRRLAAPEELSKLASFLISEDNTYLTGQTIIVDGGFTCQ